MCVATLGNWAIQYDSYCHGEFLSFLRKSGVDICYPVKEQETHMTGVNKFHPPVFEKVCLTELAEVQRRQFSEASVKLGHAPRWCWTSMSKVALSTRERVQKCKSTFHSSLHIAKGLLWWAGEKKLSFIFSVSLNPMFVSCHFAVGFCNMLCDFTGLVKCTYSNLKICMFPSVP